VLAQKTLYVGELLAAMPKYGGGGRRSFPCGVGKGCGKVFPRFPWKIHRVIAPARYGSGRFSPPINSDAIRAHKLCFPQLPRVFHSKQRVIHRLSAKKRV